MATWSKIPPPPEFTAQEQDYMNETGYTLDQMKGLLNEGQLQSKETQDILRQMSGLYKQYEVSPEQTVAATGASKELKFNQTKADAFLERYKEYGTAEGPIDLREQIKPIIERIKNDPSILSNPDKLQEIWRPGPYDPQIDPSTFFDEVDKPATPESKIAATYETRLDPEAVTALRGKITKKQEYETKVNDQAQAIIDEILNPVPTEYEKKQEEVGKLELDRYEKALKGELPVSDATKYQKLQEFNVLKENLARRGSEIYGDTPETAVGLSTSAAQSLGEFNRNWGLREDAEKRGERASGAPMSLNRYSLTSDLENRRFGQAQSVQTSPYEMPLSLLTGSQQYNPASYLPAYGSLLSGYSSALQPFANQRQLQWQTAAQNATNRTQAKIGQMNLLGQIVGMTGYGLGSKVGLFGAK